MPRVGSSRISTSGLENNHLLNTTFCWLPPDEFTAFVDHRMAGHRLQIGQRGVPSNRFFEHQTIALAILGHIRDAIVDSFLHSAGVNFLAMHQNLTADALTISAAKNTHRQLGAARAHQSSYADNLATTDVQIDAFDDLAIRMHVMVHLPVPDFKHLLANVRRALGIAVRHFAPDHVLDDTVFTHGLARAVQRSDSGAVAQHGDGIGHLGYFIEFVRDQYAGNTLTLEFKQ